MAPSESAPPPAPAFVGSVAIAKDAPMPVSSLGKSNASSRPPVVSISTSPVMSTSPAELSARVKPSIVVAVASSPTVKASTASSAK